MKSFKLFWTAHKWTGIVLAIVFASTAVTGFLLLVKKEFAWIQPPTNTGTGVLGAGTVLDASLFVPDTYDINLITATDYEVRDSGGGLVVAGTFAPGDAISFLGIQIQVDGDPAAGDSFSATPSVNQDVFTTVLNIITALETLGDQAAQRAQVNNIVGQAF